tara:strand:- start:34 stop:690 length:657 start_codon:yes stop_codon:yes gene_type:complete
MLTNYGGDPWEHINPFPYIYKSRFDFEFDVVKDRVEKYIKESQEIIEEQKTITPEKDGGISGVVLHNKEGYYPNNDFPHNWFGSEFDEFIHDCIITVWKERHFPGTRKYIERSWINCHNKGGYTGEHLHHGINLACACYLKVPDNSGGLQIKNPLSAYDTGEPKIEDYYHREYDWVTIPVKTNDVIFFPGWLLHRTEPNQVDEKRYVMSINIKHVDKP